MIYEGDAPTFQYMMSPNQSMSMTEKMAQVFNFTDTDV